MNTQNGINKVKINDIYFKVNAIGVTLSQNSFKLYNKENSTITHNCTQNVVTGNITVMCSAITSVNTEIYPNSSLDIVLEADIISVVMNATLQVSISDFSNRITSANINHIQWSDKDSLTVKNQYWVESPETVIKSTLYKNN